MDELQANAKALLDDARPAFSPSAEELEALRSRLATTPPVPGVEAEVSPASTFPKWMKYSGVLVVVALLGGSAAMLASGGADHPSVEAPTHEEVEVQPVVEPSGHEASPKPEPSPPASTPVASSRAPARLHATAGAPPVRPPRARTRRPTPAEPADTFADELDLIAQARRALAGRRFTAAHEIAQRYLARFDPGSFREEADVVRLVAGCTLATDHTLARQARRYVEGKRSAFARRVREACLARE